MKKSVVSIFCVAAGFLALSAVNTAQAYIDGGEAYSSYVTNTTNGCVRAYVEGRFIDVAPHTSSYQFYVDPGTRYLVSVFPTRFCGNQAAATGWFGGWVHQWKV